MNVNVCLTCGRAGGPSSDREPLEPLYTPDVAAGLVPTTKASLMRLLQRHKAELPEPYYRIWYRHRYRFISDTEVRFARSRLFYQGKRQRRIFHAQ